MKFTFKHIGLLIGIFLIFGSFLFFGRNQETYSYLLITGIIVSLIFFLLILFGKGTAKSKILWTAIIISVGIVEILTEPFLIDSSYRIYLTQNKNELKEVNAILKDKKGEITILNDSIYDKTKQLTIADKSILLTNRRKLRVYMISKSEDNIYYGLWGFLDVRLGITYWNGTKPPGNDYRHLEEHWLR